MKQKKNSLIKVLVELFMKFALIFVFVFFQNINTLIFAWYAYLFSSLFLVKRERLLLLIIIVLTMYNTTAWIVFYITGLIYPPFPEPSIIYEATISALRGVVLTYFVISFLFLKFDWNNWIRKMSLRVVYILNNMSYIRLVLTSLVLYIFAFYDWYTMLRIGPFVILEYPRRYFWQSFLSTSNHNVQLITISLSIILFLGFFLKRNKIFKMNCIAVLLLYYIPYVVVGARKELLIVLLSGAIIVVYIFKNKSRYIMQVGLFFVIIFFVIMPYFRDKSLFRSFDEWIMPQYILFSIIDENVRNMIDYNYLTGAWIMLPGFMRPISVVNLGQQFADLKLTTVGVGGHSFAEAFLNFGDLSVFLFPLITLMLIIMIVLLSLRIPVAGIIGIVYLFLWGRSDLWVTIFYILYGSIVFALLAQVKINNVKINN